MNKKISLGLTISLVALACALTFILTSAYNLHHFNQKVSSVENMADTYNRLSELDGLVRDEEKIFRAMDAEETGRYLPFGYLRGAPSPYQKDKRADAAKLSRIRLHLDDLVTQMGEQLYGGCIAAEPLVTGRSPCR